MKLKKRQFIAIALLLMTLLGSFVFSSCDDDDKAGEKEIKNGEVVLPEDGNVIS